MSAELVTIITALLSSSVLVSIFSLVTFLIKRRDERKKKLDDITIILKKIKEVYSLIGYIKEKTLANRVLILATTNGGGIPQANAQLYSSTLYEVYDAPLESTKLFWQKQLIDEQYLNLLDEVLDYNEAVIVTEELSDNDIIKGLYESSHVKCSHFYKIVTTPKRFIYMSLNFTENIPITPVEREIIRFACPKLAEILKDERI